MALINPKVNAIIEVFADALANPDTDHPNKDGALYGVPMFLKDLGSGLNRADAGFGIRPDARHGPEGHRSYDRELPSRRPRASRPLEHAGIWPDLRYLDQV